MKNIAVIGSTGSIGVQTLNVVRRHKDKFNIVALAGGNNSDLLIKEVREFSPKVVCSIFELSEKISGVEYFFGKDAYLSAIIDSADTVVIALSGFSGIFALKKAIELKKNVALANKESLVVGGELMIKFAKENGVNITPIDSEHSAIFQALNFDKNAPFKKLILTCSGGAFRDYSINQLKTANKDSALIHPNWKMGARVTIDSATLVNKGFEVIEAKWLYNTRFDKISAVIHRESIIHSLVEFCDNSVMAQMSYPSMELPIAIALSYPERITSDISPLNLTEISKLSFEKIDDERFPCFNLAVSAGISGGNLPAVLNGADEELVKLFLKDKIGYFDFYKGLDGALNAYKGETALSMESLISADKFGRDFIKKLFGE